MARSFTTTSQKLANDAASPALPSVGTVSLWIKPTSIRPDEQNRIYLKITESGAYFFAIQSDSTDWWHIGFYTNGEYRVASSLADASADYWHLIVYSWTSGGLGQAWLDGSSLGTRNPTVIITSPVSIQIGACDGYNPLAAIAWPSCWGKLLTAGERDQLQNYANPTSVASGDLLWHYAIDGSSPEVEYKGGPSLTVSNNPPFANNPSLVGKKSPFPLGFRG